jgi:hypothetical protein
MIKFHTFLALMFIEILNNPHFLSRRNFKKLLEIKGDKFLTTCFWSSNNVTEYYIISTCIKKIVD